MEQFKQDIAVLTEKTIDFALEIIANKQDATIFLGRGTCPYCRKFSAKLAAAVNDTKAIVYFINSESSVEQQKLATFREQYGIKTVPAYIRIENGTLDVICDSSLPIETIKSFGKL